LPLAAPAAVGAEARTATWTRSEAPARSWGRTAYPAAQLTLARCRKHRDAEETVRTRDLVEERLGQAASDVKGIQQPRVVEQSRGERRLGLRARGLTGAGGCSHRLAERCRLIHEQRQQFASRARVVEPADQQ
jgi:hypothetical protein